MSHGNLPVCLFSLSGLSVSLLSPPPEHPPLSVLFCFVFLLYNGGYFVLISNWLLLGTDLACSSIIFATLIWLKKFGSRFGRYTTKLLLPGFDLNWIFVLAFVFVCFFAPVTQSVILVARFLSNCFLAFSLCLLFGGVEPFEYHLGTRRNG